MKALFVCIALATAGPALATSQMVTLRNDPAKAKLAPAAADEAVVVALLDDRDHLPNKIAFQLYDVAARKLIVPVKGEKHALAFQFSHAKLGGVNQDVGVYVGVVPAGDYVLLGDAVVTVQEDSFCFGAPVLHVEAGSVSFVGGYRPYLKGPFTNPLQKSALAWEGDMEKARAALATFPALQARLVAAPMRNGATFDCSGDNMWAYRVPGAPDLPPADKPAQDRSAPAG